MAAFFSKTWFLWYAFAVVIIMRWFHVSAADVESDAEPPRRAAPEVEGTQHNVLG